MERRRLQLLQRLDGLQPGEPKELVDPVIRWALDPEDTDVEFVAGAPPELVPLPSLDALITHRRFVDQATQLPVAMRVIAIHKRWDGKRHTLVVVVMRERGWLA